MRSKRGIADFSIVYKQLSNPKVKCYFLDLLKRFYNTGCAAGARGAEVFCLTQSRKDAKNSLFDTGFTEGGICALEGCGEVGAAFGVPIGLRVTGHVGAAGTWVFGILDARRGAVADHF